MQVSKKSESIMSVSSKEPLFVELSASEEAAVQGGAVPVILVWGLRIGGGILLNVLKDWAVQEWLKKPGNGYIRGDNKGTFHDRERGGDVPQDIPVKGWNSAIRSGNAWVRIG